MKDEIQGVNVNKGKGQGQGFCWGLHVSCLPHHFISLHFKHSVSNLKEGKEVDISVTLEDSFSVKPEKLDP